MSLRETGKDRAKRIDPRVLRGPRWLERCRFILAGAAVLAAIGWWGAGMRFRRADAWASPGDVAAVHATWANDCNACHTDFQAIRDDAVLASSETRSVSDEKCQKCHPVAHENDPLGPFGHHALNTNDRQLGCATCHHEHRGSSQALVRTSDDNCTMCHARSDLPKLANEMPVPDLKPVTQFAATGHPFFRSLSDPELGPKSPKLVPRHLRFAKFSHQLHMMPGMAQDGDKKIWTLGQIREADRGRYTNKKGQALSDPVQLDCGSCHQSESTGFKLTKIDGLPDAVLPANTAGAYMLPITFENQCRACHSLTIEPPADVAGGAAVDAKADRTATVPHRLSASKLVEEIEKYWGSRYFKDDPTALQRRLPLPGGSADPESRTASDWVKTHSRQSASHLNKVCGKCHQLVNEQSRQRLVSADEYVDNIIPQIVPVDIPQKLLAHAQFDHSAHRATNCIVCHEDAYPVKDSGDRKAPPAADQKPVSAPDSPDEYGNPERKSSPLMIVNRDKCLECHGPLHEGEKGPIGGARFDCAECHRYHNHDETLSAILGSTSR